MLLLLARQYDEWWLAVVSMHRRPAAKNRRAGRSFLALYCPVNGLSDSFQTSYIYRRWSRGEKTSIVIQFNPRFQLCAFLNTALFCIAPPWQLISCKDCCANRNVLTYLRTCLDLYYTRSFHCCFTAVSYFRTMQYDMYSCRLTRFRQLTSASCKLRQNNTSFLYISVWSIFSRTSDSISGPRLLLSLILNK